MRFKPGTVVEDPKTGMGVWLLLSSRLVPYDVGRMRVLWSAFPLSEASIYGYSDWFAYDDELDWDVLYEPGSDLPQT